MGLNLLLSNFLSLFVMGAFVPVVSEYIHSDAASQTIKGDFAASASSSEMLIWLTDSFISLISEIWAECHPGPTL